MYCLVGPKPPVIRVHRVTSNSITLRWTGSDLGNSPVIGYRIRYKITYGEWMEKQVRFFNKENTRAGNLSIFERNSTVSFLGSRHFCRY